MNNPKWASYDVARHTILVRINDLSKAIDQEERKASPDQAVIAALEAEIDALDLQFDLMGPDNFSG